MAPTTSVGYAPNLEKFLKSLKTQSLEAAIASFIILIKRRQIDGAEQCATATAHILLLVVAKSRWTDVDVLISKVQQVGKKLTEAKRSELVIGNVVCRVLSLIRDEAAEARNDGHSDSVSDAQSSTPSTPMLHATDAFLQGNQPRRPPLLVTGLSRNASLFDMLLAGSLASPLARLSGASTPRNTGPAAIQSLRSEIIDGIEEIKDEISQADDQIASVADGQIHSSDCIMVYRPTSTVEKFLLRAASKRQFRVFNWNTDGPKDEAAQKFRKKMLAAGVQTVNLRGTAVMAYMPAVNKVIINARAITSAGSVVAEAGSLLMARAAKKMGKPVLVLGGVFKLSPNCAFDNDDMTEWGSPAASASFSDAVLVSDIPTRSKKIETVPEQFIDAYVTNLGVHTREHLEDIVDDHYNELDIDIVEEAR